jgi:hypothetical protein
VDIFSFSVLVEKIQQCNYTPTQPIQQLHPTDCQAIHIDNSIQEVKFLMQSRQELTVNIADSCPAKQCIQLNITHSFVSLVDSHMYWIQPKLQYKPVVVKYPGYVSLSWANDQSCETPLYFLQQSCPIRIDVGLNDFYSVKPFPPVVILDRSWNYILFSVRKDLEELYFRST